MDTKWKIILVISLICNLGIFYVARKALEYRSHINEFLEKYTYVVTEFSGRNTFRDANKALPIDTSEKGRIVFLGSQITAFWNLDRYFKGYQAVNRGISGQRVAGYLLRIEPDVVELHPRAVLIEFSSYNFRPENGVKEICDYVASMGDIALMNKIEPIFTTVVPVRSDFYVDEIGDYSVQDSLKEYNRWLREYCDRKNHRLVDFYDILADRDGNLPDSVSSGQILLNDKGYEIISSAVLRTLDRIRPSTN